MPSGPGFFLKGLFRDKMMVTTSTADVACFVRRRKYSPVSQLNFETQNELFHDAQYSFPYERACF